jgi:serine phosphatase RsbU (regulator of sigma subunit)
MAVEPGMPLGIVAETRYEETHCRIAAGDRLTFVSDGVLEAIDANRELYGFERTKAVSGLPANSIAEAAKRFGQEDDITVLSVIRNVALEPAVA